jgi:hypothetical protein
MKRLTSIALLTLTFCALSSCGGQQLSPWHTERLNEEFVAGDDGVQSFADYLATEERVFAELQEEVYSQVPTGAEYGLVRYSAGSAADPEHYETNWNRTFEFSQAACCSCTVCPIHPIVCAALVKRSLSKATGS